MHTKDSTSLRLLAGVSHSENNDYPFFLHQTKKEVRWEKGLKSPSPQLSSKK